MQTLILILLAVAIILLVINLIVSFRMKEHLFELDEEYFNLEYRFELFFKNTLEKTPTSSKDRKELSK